MPDTGPQLPTRRDASPWTWRKAGDETGPTKTEIDLPPVPGTGAPEGRPAAHLGLRADGQFAGLAHLERIAAEQAMHKDTSAPLPYTGPVTGDNLVALGRMEEIATGPMAAVVTAPFRVGDSGVMRLPRITVLIPAHNEAATIAQTIRSLRTQTMPVASITVVCDNCTDDTAGVAAAEGAEVMTTEGNTARKAGALNQALAAVLPRLGNNDYLLAMDADSALCPGWLEAAARVLALDRRVGAVCGAFLGEPGGGIVGQIQRNEYYRYARIINRRWQALVLSGTGSLFRVRALQEIARERGSRLPGVPGQYYSHASITEDDEITLAMKTLGWKCLCPSGCETLTEVMPTWTALWTQRMRWQKGTLGDLSAYGLTSVTRSYWLRQAGLYGGFAVSFACLVIMIAALATAPGISIAWTAAILSVTFVERTWTVRRGGWGAILLAAVIVPEAFYALWQGWLFFCAARLAIQRKEISWGHLQRGVES
jgi:poly-beta-1,6-N-acetyl-D-glucosamine synthase